MRSGVWFAAILVMMAGCSGQKDSDSKTPDDESGLSGGIDGTMSSAPGSSGPSGTATGSSTGTSTSPVPSSSSSTSSSSTSTSSTSSSSSSTTSSSTSTSTGPLPNSAPTAQVTAIPSSGQAPLSVTFPLAAIDADGDPMTWTLSFGDGSAPATGSALPATPMHTYAAGSYTATFSVTDGKETATATVSISVAPAYSLNTVLAVTTGCNTCTTSPAPSTSVTTGLPGIDATWVSLDAAAIGLAFSVTGSEPTVAFTAQCASGQSVIQLYATSGSESGIVPAGAGCMYVWKTGVAGASFNVAIS